MKLNLGLSFKDYFIYLEPGNVKGSKDIIPVRNEITFYLQSFTHIQTHIHTNTHTHTHTQIHIHTQNGRTHV